MKISEIVEDYITIRDDLTEKRKEFKDYEEIAKARLFDLEAQLLAISNDTGVESFKTSRGTAFRTTKDYCRIAAGAREDVNKWVMSTGNIMVFTSHISKIAVKELMEVNGLNPAEAGLEYIVEDVINVRKPSKT